MIFFSIGNDLSIEESKRSVDHVSIRDITVFYVDRSEDTGLVHFYLKLGDFRTVTITEKDTSKLPPNKFVTEIEITESAIAKWYEIIDLIKPSFINQLFYKFQLVDKGKNQVLNPRFNETEKQSFYYLFDETSYGLDMAFYDTEKIDSDNYHSLRIMPLDKELINVVAPEKIEIESRKDNRVYGIVTSTISSSSLFTYLNFETISNINTSGSEQNSMPVVDTTLKIEIAKSKNRTFAFAFFSVLAAFSVGYAKILSDEIKLDGVFSWSLALRFLIPAITGFLAAFQLYRLFDKK